MSQPAELYTFGDLRAYGMSAKAVRNRLRTGEFARPVTRVVARGRVGRLDLLRAGLLRGGPRAMVDRQTAAQIWLEREPTGLLHITLPHGRRVPDEPGIRYHQTRYWVPPVWRLGLPIAPPDVAAAQVCASDDLSEADRRALVTGMVQEELVTPAAVAAAAALTVRNARTQVRRLVEEVLAGAESGPEATLWRAQVEQRMPLPVLNHPLPGWRVDGLLADLRAGYEVQSRAHHAETWLADTRRFADILVKYGISLLPVLVPDIDHRLDALLGEIESFWRTRASDLGIPMPRHVPPARWTP